MMFPFGGWLGIRPFSKYFFPDTIGKAIRQDAKGTRKVKSWYGYNLRHSPAVWWKPKQPKDEESK